MLTVAAVAVTAIVITADDCFVIVYYVDLLQYSFSFDSWWDRNAFD